MHYAPEGVIDFGCVPWSNDYSHVRYYNDLSEQAADISTMMFEHSSDYVYIDKNRRLKVKLTADQLRHVNYCRFLNASLTQRWVYCFVSDITYVNDNTTEVSLEIDIFQTYLLGVDWHISPCMIERMTVPNDREHSYLFTDEPDFSMFYTATDEIDNYFNPGGVIAFTTEKPKKENGIETLWGNGWATEPAGISIDKGVLRASNAFYMKYIKDSDDRMITDNFDTFVTGMTYSGAVEAISCIFTVPDFAYPGDFEGISTTQKSDPTSENTYQVEIALPYRGNTVDGYTPKNRKLLYYPYTFAKITDFNGGSSELRYELLGSGYGSKEDLTIAIKYEATGTCQALVFPVNYAGVHNNLDAGIVTPCGAQCSWSNDQFQTWLAQNQQAMAVSVVTNAASAATGSLSVSAASNIRSIEGAVQKYGASVAEDYGVNLNGSPIKAGVNTLTGGQISNAALMGGTAASNTALGTLSELSRASKQPSVNRGAASYDLLAMSGMQGIRLLKIQVKREIAEQIDNYFSMFGYSINRVLNPQDNINTRPLWNFIKTVNSMPASATYEASTGTPSTGGAGTPADALAIIKGQFDNGITWWHTTSGFGYYNMDGNSI